MTDSFIQDLQIFEKKLKAREHFAFSKYADGEYKILSNQHIDLLAKCHGEFKYDPTNSDDSFYREELVKSFRFKHKDYYVGIGCRCCMGDAAFNWMVENSNQDSNNLTWANLFVNSNYPYYKENIIPLYAEYDVVLVCNYKANIDNLPFRVIKDFRVGTNAYKNDYNLIETMVNWVDNNSIEDKLFLICAGPFGNILVHKLFAKFPNNTYLDTGSTLDPLMGLGNTRGYLGGASTLNKTCIW